MFSKANNYLKRLDIKLTIYYTSILLLITCILLCFIYYRLERNLIKQVDKMLSDETSELIRNSKESNSDVKLVCEDYAEEISHRKHYQIWFRVLTPEGNVYFENFESSKIVLPPFNESSLQTLTLPGHPYPYLFYQKSIALTDAKKFTIQMSTPLKLPRKILDNYLENIIAIIPIILILSVGGGLLVSRKPHEILRSIIIATNSINSQNLRERLPVPKGADETKDLILSINAMMDRLEKAFMETKQFSSDVSHELRTPLFSLKGEIEVALSKVRSSEEYRKVLGECIERVDFLIKMVNDLFLITRFELKKVDLDFTSINLGETLKDLYDFFLPMAQEKTLNFAIERSDSISVNADKTRIYQLFSNLIDNAIKFTPENGSVTFSLIAQNTTATFSIKDSGIGIPEADTPYIFNRFYQADKSKSGSSRGTGLGLHICKRIVEAHGGTITVENNKDNGAHFIVTLPART